MFVAFLSGSGRLEQTDLRRNMSTYRHSELVGLLQNRSPLRFRQFREDFDKIETGGARFAHLLSRGLGGIGRDGETRGDDSWSAQISSFESYPPAFQGRHVRKLSVHLANARDAVGDKE